MPEIQASEIVLKDLPCRGKLLADGKPGELVPVELFDLIDGEFITTGNTAKVQALIYCTAGKWCHVNRFAFPADPQGVTHKDGPAIVATE